MGFFYSILEDCSGTFERFHILVYSDKKYKCMSFIYLFLMYSGWIKCPTLTVMLLYRIATENFMVTLLVSVIFQRTASYLFKINTYSLKYKIS